MRVIEELRYRVKVSQYTLKHRKAFRKVEKQLLGKNTIRGYLHDIEKPFLYLLLGKKKGSAIHKKYSRHHSRAKTREDRLQQIIDWESARYTKPDKPLNAWETLMTMYPELMDEMIPLMKEVGLI